MGVRRNWPGRERTSARSPASRRRVSAAACLGSTGTGDAARRQSGLRASHAQLRSKAACSASGPRPPCATGGRRSQAPSADESRRTSSANMSPADARPSPRSRRRVRRQPNSSRRKRAPSFANASCDGASGRQIDAALAISTAPGVKDSITAAPSYSTSRSASRMPFQSW